MKRFTFLFIMLISINSFATKFYKAKLTYNDGKIAEGYASLPGNDLFSGNVIFKATENGKTEKQKDDNIKSITYTSETGDQFYFEHTRYRVLFGKKKEKTPKRKTWVLMTFSNELIAAYNLAQSYYIDKKGKMISSTVDRSGTWADIFILFKRPGEEFPAMITSFTNGATVIGHDKQFRKSAIQYFDSEDSFNARIENKEFKHEEVYKLAEAYVAYKQGK